MIYAEIKNIWLWTAVTLLQSGLSAFILALEKQNAPKNSRIKLAILTQDFMHLTIGMHTISSPPQKALLNFHTFNKIPMHKQQKKVPNHL